MRVYIDHAEGMQRIFVGDIPAEECKQVVDFVQNAGRVYLMDLNCNAEDYEAFTGYYIESDKQDNARVVVTVK